MLPEDEALLQLDRELDERMRNLCRKGSNTDTTREVGIGNYSLSENEASIKQDLSTRCCSSEINDSSIIKVRSRLDSALKQNARKEDQANSSHKLCHDTKMQRFSKMKEDAILETFGSVENDPSSDEIRVFANKDEREGSALNKDEDFLDYDEAEDTVFDEFLDQSTKIRLKSLKCKVSHLTEVLNVKQADCTKLAQAKQEALSSLQAAEMSKRSMSKQLQVAQQDCARLSKSNKHLNDRIKEVTCECQALRKELSSCKQSQSEQKSAQTSSRVQLTRLRSDNATLKEQVNDLKKKHKDELEELKSVLASKDDQIKELERQQRNYCALVKKQELLIRVLNEQKINIGVARGAACLEEKFLSILTPLQPP